MATGADHDDRTDKATAVATYTSQVMLLSIEPKGRVSARAELESFCFPHEASINQQPALITN